MGTPIEAVAHAKALNEERMKVWHQAQDILTRASDAKRSLLASEQRDFDRLSARIDEIDRERDVYVQAERREREAAEIRETELRDLGSHTVRGRDNAEARMLTEFLTPHSPTHSLDIPFANAWHERALIRDGASASEARALAWDTGSVASAVPITTARTLYEYMEASIAMFRAPVTRVPTASGEQMKVPRLGAHAIATQVSGQGTAFAGTDPTFQAMTLDAYKYGEICVVASEVLTDAVVDIGQFLARDLGRALGRKVDTDLVTGSGSGKPNGIANAAASCGSATTGGSLITPTYEKLVDTVYGINDSYRNMGNAGWLIHDTTAAVIRKLRADAGGTTGMPLWQPSVTAGIIGGQPDTLLGFPVYTDPNVASCASNARIALFTDFSAYYLRTVNPGVVVERDDSVYFATDQVAVRAKIRVDGDLVDTNACYSLVQNV